MGTDSKNSVSQMDVYWTLLGVTPDQFQDIITRVELTPEAPRGVKHRFQIIRKLMIHGQNVHEFIDVALEQSLTAFEMALRIGHAEDKGQFNDKISLKELISWGVRKDLFSQDEGSIDVLRKMRNIVVHGTDQFVVSLIAIDIILRIVEIINGMFPPVKRQ